MLRSYIAINLKSFYASVECADRKLDPFTTNLVVADQFRTDKTICLAVNRQLAAIIEHLSEHPEVTVGYFVPDERKAGGAYVTVTGRVRHVSLPERVLVMEDGTVVGLEDVVSMSGEGTWFGV